MVFLNIIKYDWKKRKSWKGKEKYIVGVDVAFLYKVIMVGLIKQVISKQYLEGSKVPWCKRKFQTEEIDNAYVLK